MGGSWRITEEEQLKHMSPYCREQFLLAIAGIKHGDPFGHGTPPSRARPEEDAGRMLVKWIDLVVLRGGLRPGEYFYHVPNGLARTKVQGGIFKAQGLRKGWPDYGLDLPVGGYHGLRIELKAPNSGAPSAGQLDILRRLELVGFKCNVCWGFDEARDACVNYWQALS